MAGMLRGVLSTRGFEIEESATVDDALARLRSERLDLVVLDVSVDGGDGMRFVTEAARDEKAEENERRRRREFANGTGILVLRRPSEAVPTDCMRVKGDLVKPFGEAALKAAVDAALPHERRPEPPPEEWTKVPSDPESELTNNGVVFGESYVYFRQSQDEVHRAMRGFALAGYEMILVTEARPKVARERFGLDQGAEVLTLTGSNYRLGSVVAAVEAFVDRSEHPVIAVDDLDAIIDRCGTERTLRAVAEMERCGGDKKKTLLVSADGELMGDNVRRLLSDMMVLYTKEREGYGEDREGLG